MDGESQSRFAGAWPALLTLIAGVAVLLLRPALPLDEVRYLEVLREMKQGGLLLLRCDGAPYADKPPLLFWCARLLETIGVSGETALRLIPALASAALVILVERLGRRIGFERAGFLHAALLLPFIYAQVVLFDPLLSLCVWLALAEWCAGRDLRAAIFGALAFLAKGPVAAFFLIPFGFALAPTRQRRVGTALRGISLTLLAALPLVVWALVSAWMGGEEFARELLWDRWAGRVNHAFAHQRSFFYYVPIALVGALPALPLLRLSRAPSIVVRLGLALGVVLLLLSCVSGKQPHYLLPLAPAVALIAAWRLGNATDGESWLRRAVVAELALTALAAAGLLAWRSRLIVHYGVYNEAVAASNAWALGVAGAATIAAAMAALFAYKPVGTKALLTALIVGLALLLMPLHVAAGELLLPRAFADAVRLEPNTPLLLYKLKDPGIYAWIAQRSPLETAATPAEFSSWAIAHPGGLLLLERKYADEAPPLATEVVGYDWMAGDPLVLLRARKPEGGTRE